MILCRKFNIGRCKIVTKSKVVTKSRLHCNFKNCSFHTKMLKNLKKNLKKLNHTFLVQNRLPLRILDLSVKERVTFCYILTITEYKTGRCMYDKMKKKTR